MKKKTTLMMGCSRSKAIVEETQNGRGSNKEKKKRFSNTRMPMRFSALSHIDESIYQTSYSFNMHYE